MGFDGKVFAAKTNISPQHLSQIETAYDKGGRGPVGPSDEVIEAISETLGWRVIDIRRMLGQIPDSELVPADAESLVRARIQERGYDSQQFDAEGVSQIARSIDALLEGTLAQKRRDRGESE